METLHSGTFYVEKFNDIYEFERAINYRKENKAFQGEDADSKYEGSADWYGSKNFDEANKLLSEGYEAGSNYLCKAISSSSSGTQCRTILNFVGAAPCVGAVLAGNPLNMFDRVKQKTIKKEITINFERSQPSSVSTQAILDGAVKLLNVIRSFEMNGIKVNLNVICGAKSGGQHAVVSVKVKDARLPLNILLVAYPLCHPSWHRRHIFRWRETAEGITSKSWTNGYGKSLSSIYEMNELKGIYTREGIIKDDEVFITLDFLRSRFINEDNLIKEISKQSKLN